METVTLPKQKFSKLLTDVELLINDVDEILSDEDSIVKKRIADVKSGNVKGVTEAEYYGYLKKRLFL